MDKREIVTGKVSEGPHGWWWAVYQGDGTQPGSLLGGGGGGDLVTATSEMADCVNRSVEHRDCEHEPDPGDPDFCAKCRIYLPAHRQHLELMASWPEE